MKQLYISLLFIFGITFCASAQNSSPNQRRDIKKVDYITAKDTTYHHFDKYIFDDKKMKSFLKDGHIPASLPLYDHQLSYAENKKIAIEWAKEHPKLIKKELRYKFEK